MTKIGSARHDENGKISGGKAGDQTGEEVSTQEWYQHKKGWVCIRAKKEEQREKIAWDMEAACKNNNIGYDQGQNQTLYAAARQVGFDCSKVTTKCETDCARLVRVCVLYAGIQARDFYTGDEVEKLQATGAFDILREPRYTEAPDYLKRGDILVTKTKGHTVVVLEDGPKAHHRTHTTLRKGSEGPEVSELQQDLNLFCYRDNKGEKLAVDGSFGSKTKAAVQNLQKDQGLTVDGICGPITWGKIDDMLAMIYRIRIKTNLNLREGPGTEYPVKKVLQEGQTFLSTRKASGWLYLPLPEGWVSEKYTEYA